ncbi:MAG TPA: DUF4230 domain-containing protein [Flavobacterium sp.]|nr:DUF4230 domain-containing protein [Flavobacterium sp.]
MRRILLFAGIVLAVLLAFRFCEFKKEDTATIEYNTSLIQERIANVGKLIVTEGHFAEVLTYKDQDKYLMDMISFEKKALVVVNADVAVAYDLRQMKYAIDEKNKTITITYIPKEEIKISPDIQFYDVSQSRMNPFSGEDYNKISKSVKAGLAKKIEKSALKSNAKNRLVSELSKIFITTSALGWTLKYEGKTVDEQSLDKVLL